MKKISGLRKRWLINTAGLVCILGLACALGITAVFANHYYSGMESDLRFRAECTADFLADDLHMAYDGYYQSLVAHTESFEADDSAILQFIDANGQLAAASDSTSDGAVPATPDIREAISSRGICVYRGTDPQTGERIMAVSSPVIYSNGEVMGVLRFAASTQNLDRQILEVALFIMLALVLIVIVVLICSDYYIRSILVPVQDITEKAKRIAAGSYGIQIQTRYNDEIGELAQTINDLSAKINQNEIMQTEFISSLSHELRTPLTAINGWSETLLAGNDLDAETRRGMKIISREAKRLTEMVVELLDFTRIQDGRMTLHMEPTDIRSEFEDTVYMYGSRLVQDGIALNYLDNDDEFPEITCDPKRLRQVFLNILDNAAKHGGEGKRIDASIHCEDDSIVVRIRDFGPGIPEDELPLVKKKFYKGSSKARGTGIGLAVCDEIVEMHGGTLELSNDHGGGTLVTVTLPAAQ